MKQVAEGGLLCSGCSQLCSSLILEHVFLGGWVAGGFGTGQCLRGGTPCEGHCDQKWGRALATAPSAWLPTWASPPRPAIPCVTCVLPVKLCSQNLDAGAGSVALF